MIFLSHTHADKRIVDVVAQRLAAIRFLTTVPNGNQSPSVWLDMLHPGVRVQFRLLEQQIHGVPIRVAIPLGLITCLIVLVLSSLYISEPWAAALVCMIFGLVAQSIGAIVYRGLRVLKHLVLR